MTNLVILYTGNVGSTPLVQTAARHPRILVPVHEEFDRYRIETLAPDADPAALLAEALEALCRRETAPYLALEKVRARRETDALPPAGAVPHLVFKWRSEGFGPGTPGSDRLREAFARHAFRPLLLARRSVVEQALKVHLSEAHYGGRHQQFRAARLSEADYAAYLRDQDAASIRVDADGLARIRAIAGDFLHRTESAVADATHLFPDRAPPALVLSEQVLRPDLDYDAVSRLLSAALGEEIRLTPDMTPRVRRGGLGPEHCANPEAVASDRALRRIESRYRALLRGLPLLEGARPPRPFAARLRALVSPPPVALGAADPLG